MYYAGDSSLLGKSWMSLWCAFNYIWDSSVLNPLLNEWLCLASIPSRKNKIELRSSMIALKCCHTSKHTRISLYIVCSKQSGLLTTYIARGKKQVYSARAVDTSRASWASRTLFFIQENVRFEARFIVYWGLTQFAYNLIKCLVGYRRLLRQGWRGDFGSHR